MESFSQMQIFFLISSVGLIILFVLVSIFLFYLVTTMYSLRRIIFKVEKGISRIGDTTKYLLEDMRKNAIFKLVFGKKKRSKY